MCLEAFLMFKLFLGLVYSIRVIIYDTKEVISPRRSTLEILNVYQRLGVKYSSNVSIFTIPVSLCEKIMNSFWWEHASAQNKGFHQLSWDKLSMHKDGDDMSFKNRYVLNLDMLDKQGWLIRTNLNLLISQLFKAKYFPHCDFLNSTLRH